MMGRTHRSLQAVLLVTCSFLAHALTHGLSTSMGVLYGEWKKEFEEQAALISWLSTSMLAVLLGTSPLAGALTQHFGIHVVTSMGGLLAACGFMAASFADDVRILYFTIPFMTGLGNSMAYTGAVVSVARSFKKHFAIFNGVASTGSGMGMILWPILLQLLVDRYKWEGTLMVLAGLQLNLIPLALLLSKLSIPNIKLTRMKQADTREHTMKAQEHADSRRSTEMAEVYSPNSDIPGDEEVANAQKNDITFVVDRNSSSDEKVRCSDTAGVGTEVHVNLTGTLQQTQSQDVQNENDRMDSCAPHPIQQPCSRNRKKSSKLSRLKASCVHSTGLSLLWENGVLLSLLPVHTLGASIFGTLVPHAKAAAVKKGIPPLKAAFILSVVGIANVISRATHGLLLQTGRVHLMLLYASSFSVAGISLIVMPITESYVVIVLCAVGVGIGSGIYIPLQFVILRHVVPSQCFPGAMGVTLFAVCCGIMSSSLLSGYVLDKNGNYQLVFTISGCLGLSAGIMVLVEHIIWNHCLKDKRWPPKRHRKKLEHKLQNDAKISGALLPESEFSI